MKRSKKFQFMYTGPYVVVRKLGAVNYLIKRNDRTPAIVVHADKLKACQDPLCVNSCRVKRHTESLKSCSLEPQCGSSGIKVTCCVADSMDTSTTNVKKGRCRRWTKKAKKPREEGEEPPQPQTRQLHVCSACQAEVWGYRPWKQHLRRCAQRMAARSMEQLPAPQFQYPPAPEVQYLPAPEVQYLPAPEIQYPPAPEVQYLPAPQVQYLPAPQLQYLPAPQLQYLSAPELPTECHRVMSVTQSIPAGGWCTPRNWRRVP